MNGGDEFIIQKKKIFPSSALLLGTDYNFLRKSNILFFLFISKSKSKVNK